MTTVSRGEMLSLAAGMAALGLPLTGAQHLPEGAGVAVSVGFMRMAPKLSGAVGHIWRHGPMLAQLPRLRAAMLAEVLLSALLAPVVMVHRVSAVLRVFWGLDGGWKAHGESHSTWRTRACVLASETGLGFGLFAFAAAQPLDFAGGNQPQPFGAAGRVGPDPHDFFYALIRKRQTR